MVVAETKILGGMISLLPIIALSAVFGLVAVAGSAKPLLTDSQDTYVSACLEQSDAPERVIEICQHGLGGIGASDRQRIEMLDKLGWAYYDLDALDEADEAFTEILTLDPNAEVGLQGRAWVMYNRDAFPQAAE